MGKEIIAGCDEAGRGCIIGPLVLAGVSVEREKEIELKKIGVRDSKELPQKKRLELAEKIRGIAKDIVVMKVGPCKIDTFMKQGVSLNKIEAMKFADILKILSADTSYIDAPENNLDKFTRFMVKLTGGGTEIIAKHKADRDHPVVSAASIMAKVGREEEITNLKEKFGDFGSGYTSDEKTVTWLRELLKKEGKFPEHLVRKSWSTADALLAENSQKSLGGWIKSMVKK